MITPLWSDNPSDIDLLNFRLATDLVRDAVLQDKLNPVTLGIEGDWGSGKTSMLKFLAKDLRDQDSVLVVETHPWEYDPSMDPKATLIAEVLDAIHKEADDRKILDKVREKFKLLAKRVRISKLLKLSANTALAGGIPNVVEVLDLFDDGETVPDLTLKGFRNEFTVLMENLREIDRVVVVVDDLDRCLPQTIIATLETIKLFLSVERMAFVVAADRRVIAEVVSTKYQPSPYAVELGAQYSDKIIQIPVSVPTLLRPVDTESYLALLILQHHSNDENFIIEVAKHCNSRRSAGEQHPFSEEHKEGFKFDQGARAHLDLATRLAPELHESYNGNPRRLKRFLNAYFMRDTITRNSGITLRPEVLAAWMVLEECHPDAFDELLDWWRNDQLQERLQKLREGVHSKDAGDQAEVLRSWAQSWTQSTLEEFEPDRYLALAASLCRRTKMPVAAGSDALSRDFGAENPQKFKGIVKSPETDMEGFPETSMWQIPESGTRFTVGIEKDEQRFRFNELPHSEGPHEDPGFGIDRLA